MFSDNTRAADSKLNTTIGRNLLLLLAANFRDFTE